jgi:hypothetical protein
VARVRKHYGKWQVLYRDPSTKRERSAGVFSRKGDADKKRRILEYRIETGEWIDPALGRTAFASWSNDWIASRAHLTPKTLEGYRSLLNSRVLPTFADVDLQYIRTTSLHHLSPERYTGL